MRILLLANNDVGLFKFRRELVEKLAKNNQVYIALPEGEFIPKLIELGCKFIDVEFNRRGTNPISDFKLLCTYISLILRIKPDVVLTYTIKPTIYGGYASRLTKTKYIVNITGLGTAVENPGILQKMILKMYKGALRKVSCIFFQNSSNYEFFKKLNLMNSRYRIIPGSGVNVDEHIFEAYPIVESSADKFLFIGRIMKDKGIEELFEAATKIKKEYPKVTFDIVGGADEDYSSKIENLERQGIIKYWNQQPNVHSFIKECGVVVLPSYHEGMANVLLEASSAGRPVLASKIPGCVETFEEGVTGFGVKVRDADDLYRKIKHFILLDYNRKVIMGKEARKKMEKEFNRQQVIDAYLEEINNLEEKKNVTV